jgi:hypothetical protein
MNKNTVQQIVPYQHNYIVEEIVTMVKIASEHRHTQSEQLSTMK